MTTGGEHDLLLAVDLQNDFCAGGVLAVPGADELVPKINRLAAGFAHVVLTQDWHPPGHCSFASSHPGHRPYETIQLAYGAQALWPEHCVQGSAGAGFHPQLAIPHAELILRKGCRREVDAYSAFRENDRHTPTGLAGYLLERGLHRLFLVGLATDYCVLYTALDARQAGFEVVVLLDACRAIDQAGSLSAALQKMAAAGIKIEH